VTLRLRHFRMRAMTHNGLYGTDIPFEPGLNIIWADNTKGKSTCMQGMLYALGLEKMLSPRREIPLPHAMTRYLRNDDDTSEEIIESNVSLEIENGAGQIITVHRTVVNNLVDNRLITVQYGPGLTGSSISLKRRDFFVIDGGAAQREDGFHRFLEDFLGWSLPAVSRYDGPEGKLYLETIFPLFWIEQKSGWSAIPAAIPTYLKIREVQKRAVEFIMDLDVYQLELKRQRLRERIDQNTHEWNSYIEELDRYAKRNFCKIDALPHKPTVMVEEIRKSYVGVIDGDQWMPLKDVVYNLRKRLSELSKLPVVTVGASAEALTQELEALNKEVEAQNRLRIELYKAKQLKEVDISSLERRIKSISHDIQKNQDVQKLHRYSGRSNVFPPDRCPTCEQSLVDSLLSQRVVATVMPIEDNIEYLRSQIKMFEGILEREKAELQKLMIRSEDARQSLMNLYSRIRTVRSDLVSSTGTPSAAAVEERVRIETRIRELEAVQDSFEEIVERMVLLAEALALILREMQELPREKMSLEDHRKFRDLTEVMRSLAKGFGFSTFNPEELEIDEDTYRPQKEGYEIGFETSASDAIRLKWAYQFGLLELGRKHPTNHPMLLVLDEPRQQSSSRVSFGKLLECAADYRAEDHQVVVATSEDLGSLLGIISDIPCKKNIFRGYVLKPIDL
jgi:AAA domain